MMERHTVPPIRTGALTLLIALSAVCLAVLAVLSLTAAQADLTLAQKSMDRLTQDAALENQGQQWLAQLDETLASSGDAASLGQINADGSLTVTFSGQRGGSLTITALPTPKGPKRWQLLSWQFGQQREAAAGPQLWDGSF